MFRAPYYGCEFDYQEGKFLHLEFWTIVYDWDFGLEYNLVKVFFVRYLLFMQSLKLKLQTKV